MSRNKRDCKFYDRPTRLVQRFWSSSHGDHGCYIPCEPTHEADPFAPASQAVLQYRSSWAKPQLQLHLSSLISGSGYYTDITESQSRYASIPNLDCTKVIASRKVLGKVDIGICRNRCSSFSGVVVSSFLLVWWSSIQLSRWILVSSL